MHFIFILFSFFFLVLGISSPTFAIGPEAIPDDIADSVKFWTKIYSEYDSDQRVFYNRKHPDLVYGVLDLSTLRKKYNTPFVFEKKSREFILKEKKDYRLAFKLAEKGVTSAKDPNVHRILKSIINSQSLLSHKHSFHDQRRSLRIQTGQRDQVDLAIKRSAPYKKKIIELFEKEGIPPELFYISFVESSFNIKAHSRSDAVGIWQFLAPTAKKFLKIDKINNIDERRDPILASRAAAKLLKQNHKLLSKSWPLAITAYHHGFKHLVKIPKNTRSTLSVFNYLKLCDPKGKIGWVSRNYYSEFRAMLLAVDILEKLQPRFAQNEI